MASDQEIADLQRQVQRHEELIAALYRKLGIGQLEASALGSDGPPADLVEAIRAGSMIEAIKRWRAHTGSGLKEAKDAVEALASSIGA